jgi:hypothetical protein
MAGIGKSPSDAMVRKPWPLWRKVMAYLLMLALASASIWLIDRLSLRAFQLQQSTTQ